MASVSNDFKVKIWDATNNNWNLIRNYSSHTGAVQDIEYINGDTVATASSDRTIKIWSIKTGITNRTISTSGFTSLKLLQNGYHLSAGLTNGLINIYDTKTGTLFKSLNGHVNQVTDLALINNDLLASSSSSSVYIRIWNLTTYKVKYTLSGHTNAVYRLKLVSPSILASASEDRTIKLWSLLNGLLIRTLTGHTLGITSVDLTSSQILASGSKDQTIKFWNFNTGALVSSINTGASVNSIGAVYPIVIGNICIYILFKVFIKIINRFIVFFQVQSTTTTTTPPTTITRGTSTTTSSKLVFIFEFRLCVLLKARNQN
jgi:WD40 repeat protein